MSGKIEITPYRLQASEETILRFYGRHRTKWAKSKPERIGVYEVVLRGSGSIAYRHWDGKTWGSAFALHTSAEIKRDLSTHTEHTPFWRGLRTP